MFQRRNAVAMAAAVLAAGLSAPTLAVTIADWESGIAPAEAALDWGGSSSVTAPSNKGVTHGAGSLQITKPSTGWQWAVKIAINPNDFIANDVLTLDLTRLSSEWVPMPTGDKWSQVGFIIQGDGLGQTRVDNILTWASTDANADAPQKITYDYRAARDARTVTNPTWAQFILYLNDGGYAGPNGPELNVYLDNFQLSKLAPALPGDFDNDGDLDRTDLDKLLNGYQNHLTGYENGDINGDGKVSEDDVASFHVRYADYQSSHPAGAAVPEPAAIAALSLLAPAILRRHRTA